ncbi:penicillin-binding protein 1C [Leptospira perolatii]|uniref:peptidoglycan glycosyltransferase n=1 Tax=Leptospira perolatii TaxID=2023191 RepID=A0A2M9ZJV3_9LEPT|nr:penicillin-binding protein 1C [Leptospira perolatii]PJZ69553.1 penicillin-binding protein 1C [Leptospira perolatii]PJZ72320.1 penicillin-binding protein 1C [Leptospira perolatii]
MLLPFKSGALKAEVLVSELLDSYGEEGKVPSFREFKNWVRPSEGILLDRNGFNLHSIRLNHKTRMLEWVEEREINETFLFALLAQEDKRFLEHSGVDKIALFAAMKDWIFSGRKRGASTITMQLAGILLGSKPGGRTLFDKWKQMELAWALEDSWTKAQIAEAYWNLIPFRGQSVGLRAASREIFGVDPSSLSSEESVLLVSLLRNPNIKEQKWAERACSLSKKIAQPEFCDRYASIIQNSKVKIRQGTFDSRTIAYHATYRIFKSKEAPVSKLRTGIFRSTLDVRVQTKSLESMERVLLELKDKNAKEGGVLVLENKTGAVVAYIGNSKISSEHYLMDAIQSKRQAGSTLKPFLYGFAFQKNVLLPDSILLDQPTQWELLGGVYKPTNYEGRYLGPIPAKVALASSLNIPAVKVLDMVGVPEFVSLLNELGFSQLQRPDFYGLSLALGTADVSLWELTNAFRTIANEGYWNEPTFDPDEAAANLFAWETEKETAFRKVLEPRAAGLVSEILSSRENRAPTFQWENHLATRFFTAAKTGTSQDMRDNWCVGFSKNYTVGVWIGNMNGEPMHDVSGVSGAAPLWKEVIHIVEDLRPKQNLVADTFVSKESIERIFYANQNKYQNGMSVQIVYPATGNIFALDPEIPAESERIRFRSNSVNRELEWILNGVRIAKNEEGFVDWKPKRGGFMLSVRDPKDGKILDTVAFQVR